MQEAVILYSMDIYNIKEDTQEDEVQEEQPAKKSRKRK